MLGPNDAVDEFDIALGKCNFVHNYNMLFHVVGLFVHLQLFNLVWTSKESRRSL